MKKVNTLVFEGGCVKGLAYVGVLRLLAETEVLNKNFIFVSILLAHSEHE